VATFGDISAVTFARRKGYISRMVRRTTPLASFFGNKDPVGAAEAALAAGVKELAGRTKLASDAQAVFDAKTVAANAMGGADDLTLQKAEAAVTEAGAILNRRLKHVEDQQAEVARLETVRDGAITDRDINATCIFNHRLKSDFKDKADVLLAAAAELAGICEQAELIAPEAGGFKQFMTVLVSEGPGAVALISKLVDVNTAAVEARQAPAKGKRLVAPVIAPVVTAPVRMTVFALRSVKFTDPDSGKFVVVQQFQDAEMPPSFAKVALEQRVCVRLSDPLRKANHGQRAGHAEVQYCYDLDAAMNAPKQSPIDPIMSAPAPAPASPFKVLDRGPATQMKVKV
jgi:hypothetical protein